MSLGLAARVVWGGLKLVSWPVRNPITTTFVIAASQVTGIGEQLTDPVVELGGKSISWAISEHGIPKTWDMIEGTAAASALAIAGIDSEEKLEAAYNQIIGSDPDAAAEEDRDASAADPADPNAETPPARDDAPASDKEEEDEPGILDAASANTVYNLVGERLGIDRAEFDNWWQKLDPVEFGKKSLWVKGADTAFDTITGIDLLTTKQCVMISLAWHAIEQFGLMEKAANMFRGMFGDQILPSVDNLRNDGLGFREAVAGPEIKRPEPPALREDTTIRRPEAPAPTGADALE